MTHKKIPLVKDTVDKNDIKNLIKWLKTNPRLTKGDLTVDFEKKWSEWLGVKYSVFINSGSSANLAMIYSLILSNKLKNNKQSEKMRNSLLDVVVVVVVFCCCC